MRFELNGCKLYGGLSAETIMHSVNSKMKHGTGIFADDTYVLGFNNLSIFPGFVDVHTHLREPGFSYKETILNGSATASFGGYTTVFTMPNLNPVPHNLENLRLQLDIIDRDARINVLPYGAITVDEAGEKLAEMDELAPYVIAFSDDGRGVQNDELMLSAMKKAKKLGKIIVAHCEDNSLLHGGYIHDGVYAKKHGHKGICSESEWKQVERDLALVAKSGCAYHVCHVSTKESVRLIRQAKRDGLNVTCETAPHYLLLCEDDLQEDGRFKMNPPLRAAADRDALVEGLCDGTIDMIATDHAPHTAEEKSRGLAGSAMGVIGLQFAFPLLYTYLVKKGVITLEKLVDLMSLSPRKRFGLPLDTGGDFCVYDLEKQYKIDSETIPVTAARATPFDGWEVFGECELTSRDYEVVYSKIPKKKGKNWS